MEPRNVCFDLCTDEFNSFGSFAAPYSCWLIIPTIYILPSGMCMRLKFIFLSTIIIDPYSLGNNIDVCLQPLIDKLNQLLSFEVLTYDVLRKQNFQMKTTLIWTINDFPGMKWFQDGAHIKN
jgi:hypothetical protein